MKSTWAAVFAASAIFGAGAACGQDQASAPPPLGVVDRPCDALEPPPAEVTAFMQSAAKAQAAHQPPPQPLAANLAAYGAWQSRRLGQDFAGLCRYHDQNAALPAATDHRVVFFGDSITELWGQSDPGLFANDVVDRGISGQTTAQMVGRFQQDVIDLNPRVIHILAGTNDIAGNTGPTTLAWIEANVRTMVELAKAHHIHVVLAAVLPAARYSWRPSIEPVAQIQALNAWLKAYAEAEHIGFVDYAPALDDGRHGIKSELSGDGVHPNAAGFAAMRPLADRALREALR